MITHISKRFDNIVERFAAVTYGSCPVRDISGTQKDMERHQLMHHPPHTVSVLPKHCKRAELKVLCVIRLGIFLLSQRSVPDRRMMRGECWVQLNPGRDNNRLTFAADSNPRRRCSPVSPVSITGTWVNRLPMNILDTAPTVALSICLISATRQLEISCMMSRTRTARCRSARDSMYCIGFSPTMS
jgi:hypothetical protein